MYQASIGRDQLGAIEADVEHLGVNTRLDLQLELPLFHGMDVGGEA